MNEETKDCARLPVVASLGDYPEIWLAPKCHDDCREWCQDDVWGECGELHVGGEPCDYQSVRYVHGRLLTDAQARLAEKDARIAQLAAHARGKNKALANALKEIERLRLNIAEYNEHESCWRAEIANLRAQLEQLQAAPAERGVVRQETNFVASTGEGRNPLYEGQFDDETPEQAERRLHWSRTAMEVQSARLNPAPATADSDVREVSE